MRFTNRILFLIVILGLSLYTTYAFATNYKMKFNPQTGRGDWVVDDSSLGGGGSSCWETDSNSDLQPVSASCTDSLWEEDGSGDLQPQA